MLSFTEELIKGYFYWRSEWRVKWCVREIGKRDPGEPLVLILSSLAEDEGKIWLGTYRSSFPVNCAGSWETDEEAQENKQWNRARL